MEEKPLTGDGHELLFVELFKLGWATGWVRSIGASAATSTGLVACFGVVVALILLAKGILYLP
ncbi:MAG: hypothetical protein R2748_31485 [Bryobacterales bacterium]